MKAVVAESKQVSVRELPKPEAPQGEVLIQVRLAGICSTDLEIIQGYAGYEGVIGHEFVGTVVSGSKALSGKRVGGAINCVCGRCDMCTSGLANHCRRRTVLGIAGRPGAFAEFLTLPEANCIEVPENVSDDEAVFAEPLAAAIQVLRQVKIEPRSTVAVLGTGRLGILVAAVLADSGCKLTALGRNPHTLAILDRLRIRNSLLSDWTQWNGFDVVVECTGSPEGLPIALKLVRPRGIIVLKTTSAATATADLSALVVNEVTLLGSRCGPMADAIGMLAQKKIDVAALVTRTFPLEEAVAALRLAAEPNTVKVLLKVAR